MRKKLSKLFLCFLLTAMMISSVVCNVNAEEASRAANYDKSFSYNGSVQTYTVPVSGYYKLEVWGAEGGKGQNANAGSGGLGGYSVGYKELKKGDILYIACGEKGANGDWTRDGDGWYDKNYTLAYNGGGGLRLLYLNVGAEEGSAEVNGRTAGQGGGATHIAINSNRGELYNYSGHTSEILIVAGGGGGGAASDWAYGRSFNGGAGGGLTGGNGVGVNTDGASADFVHGGTQSSVEHSYLPNGASYDYSSGFGRAGSVYNSDANWDIHACSVAGGGGGWYGGATGGYGVPGAGGSGYIGGCLSKLTYGGSTYASDTAAGNNSGNGRAAITYLGPVYYRQTVQVRYENADGSFTSYTNVINQDYGEGEAVTWTRPADSTYQAASVNYTVTAAKTTQVTVYRQKYQQTVQVRYENADGTFTAYTNAINQNYTAGAAVTWAREADSTYQAASVNYTVTAAKTTQVTVYRRKYLQTVQVRYENADGTLTEYEDAINEDYIAGSTAAWSREADGTYQAADVNYTVTENATTQVTVYRQQYMLTLEKGIGIDTVDGEGEYRAGQSVTIEAEVTEGYEFCGWSNSETLTGTESRYEFEMPINNLSYTAVAAPIEYSVTYNLEGGDDGGKNPGSYTVESEAIVLEQPAKEGYSFLGWSESKGSSYQLSVTIPKGSTGDKIYWANWKKDKPADGSDAGKNPGGKSEGGQDAGKNPGGKPEGGQEAENNSGNEPEDESEDEGSMLPSSAPVPTPAPTAKRFPVDDGSEAEEGETEVEEPQLIQISSADQAAPAPSIKEEGTINIPEKNVGISNSDRSDNSFREIAAAIVIAIACVGIITGILLFVLFWFLRKCKIYDARTEELIGGSIIRKDRKGMYWIRISDSIYEKSGTKIYIVLGNNFVRSNTDKLLKISICEKEYYRQIQEKVDLQHE